MALSYVDILTNYGISQARLFESNNTVFCECLVKFRVQRKMLASMYFTFTFLGKLKSLELLPQDEKVNIWNTAHDISNRRMDKKQILELCKALYMLEYLLNLK